MAKKNNLPDGIEYDSKTGTYRGRASFTLPYGRRTFRKKSGFATVRDAKRWRAKLIADHGAGKYVEPARVTVPELLETDTETEVKLGNFAPSTAALYRRHARAYVNPAFGNRRAQDVRSRGPQPFLR
jgi:hypothetical protein